MMERKNTYAASGAGPRPAAKRRRNQAGLLFFSVQLGYGAMLAVEASPRLSEPTWVGLGMMGLFFAAAAILFISAGITGLRNGTAMRSSRLVYPASMLMLAGAVCMVVGLIISQARPE